MFVRKKINKSKSVSVQIVQKDGKHLRIVKHFGTATDNETLDGLIKEAKEYLTQQQMSLFSQDNSAIYDNFLKDVVTLKNIKVGFVEVFGKIYDDLGYNDIGLPNSFKSIVIARIANPTSKLHLSSWLQTQANINISDDQIYRLMDKVNQSTEILVSDTTFKHVLKIVGGEIHMVFFDATTLHFETFDSDNFRKCGYSKVGKHNQPQVVIGLMTTKEGLPIGYDVFPGNKFDGHTIRSALTRVSRRYNVSKVTFVADAGMTSKDNIKLIESRDFNFIMAAKLHSITRDFQNEIFSQNLHLTGKIYETNITLENQYRLVVTYSESRAAQDKKLRDDQIIRLKKTLASKVKVTKTKVGKIGKSKYLRVVGNASVEIDYESILEDAKWDGLKGYVTNIPKTELSSGDIVARYTDLWQIEKAFRISKQDLKIRPIFHWKRSRIRAHILITFMGLVILRYISYLIKDMKMSETRLIEEINNITETHISHPKASIVQKTRTSLSKNIQKIYEILEIKNG